MMAEQQKNEAQEARPGGSTGQQQEASTTIKIDGDGDQGGREAKDENKDTSFKYYLVSDLRVWLLAGFGVLIKC